MSRTLTLSIVVASLSLAACKKDEKAGGGDKPAGKPAETDKKAAEPPKPTGPFAAWDLDARTKAWQGAHVAPLQSLGSWSAIEVKGDKVVVWDGKEEKTLDFAVLSPCEARFMESLPDGSRSGWTSHYTIKDGKIVAGMGDAGSRKGKEAIACVSNTIVVMDASGTCTEWKASMFDDGKYEQAPATCRWLEEDGKEMFGVTIRDWETKLLVDGDALMTEQLAQTHSEPVADLAAAKAARDERAK